MPARNEDNTHPLKAVSFMRFHFGTPQGVRHDMRVTKISRVRKGSCGKKLHPYAGVVHTRKFVDSTLNLR